MLSNIKSIYIKREYINSTTKCEFLNGLNQYNY